MDKKNEKKLWAEFGMTRREFLRSFGIATSALTLSPFFIDRFSLALAQVPHKVKVYMVKNGDCFQNIARLWELGGLGGYIDNDDFVVIKGNAQWENQGYTHTGCIKAFIDKILATPGFSSEIFICDNTQGRQTSGVLGFDATEDNRVNNWPDHNWESLAEEYQNNGDPVAVKRWMNSTGTIEGPQDGEGWIRSFFDHHGVDTYFSYPIFESPLTQGKMIDMKNGVWENGAYSGQKVKAIFMPTLNYHSPYAGITSAIKSFFGATEIHGGQYTGQFQGHYNVHSSTYENGNADHAGELTARYIKTMYAPIMYITCAIYSGQFGRTGHNAATETKTVMACTNPATLDYVACRDVIAPLRTWDNILDPDLNTVTRKQILGCIGGGVGTINPNEFEIVFYDFNNPSVHRVDIDRKIRQFKAGTATEQEVRDLIRSYMEGP